MTSIKDIQKTINLIKEEIGYIDSQNAKLDKLLKTIEEILEDNKQIVAGLKVAKSLV